MVVVSILGYYLPLLLRSFGEKTYRGNSYFYHNDISIIIQYDLSLIVYVYIKDIRMYTSRTHN